MRIVAGVFGGRRIAAPRDTRVRPTADRVREAWMSILSDEIRGARVLDLFAGSGALGLEALSRGAVSADFVEIHRASLAALSANIAALGVEDRARVHRGDAERFVGALGKEAFDVAFADPPYSVDHASRIAAHFHRAPFARILSIEHRADLALPGGETRRYGDTAITFFHAS